MNYTIRPMREEENGMNDFISEVKSMPTSDIQLILQDQLELYTKDEIEILTAELNARPHSEADVDKERQERMRISEELDEKERKQKTEKMIQRKIDRLRNLDYEGYWEYKVINVADSNSGSVDPTAIENQLNVFGLQGWHLKCAYSNELGSNSYSGGFGGFVSGTNATVDQHVLILERFVKI